MMQLILSLFLSLLIYNSANAADFEGATEFESYDIRGKYTATCVSGTTRHTVHLCKAQGMHPYGWARFSHVVNEKVTKVKLKSTSESGRVINRKSNWDQELNQSFKQFNLFKKSLFLTPLVEEGENLIEWTLLDGRKTVESGSFIVTVKRGNHLRCPHLKETKVFDSSICKDGMKACNRYFKKVKQCEPVDEAYESLGFDL